MKHFVTVLTDTCKIDQIQYVIHTSIYQYTYKIEVFQDAMSIDSTEVTCHGLATQKNSNQLFITHYQQAHQAMRNKFCEVSKNNTDFTEVQIPVQNKHMNYSLNSISYFTKKIILLSLFILVSLWIGYRYFYIYSDTYIYGLHTKKEKILYLEKIENDTKIIENTCMSLSQKHPTGHQDIFTIPQCTSWCHKHIIDSNKCTLILAYFKMLDSNTSSSLFPKQVKIKENKHLTYTIAPKETLIELYQHKSVDISIVNTSTHAILCTLKDITVVETQHDEIVQVKDTISRLIIKTGEKKSFSIFLEPSYYNQFKAGKYTGTIYLEVNYKHTTETFSKAFFFVVK